MGDEDIVQFRQTLRGRLITPGDPDYDEARALYNGMIDKRPALIAQCVDVADVVAAVNFGRDNGLLVAIRGGGHNGPGLGSVDDGLVIDLSMMKGVRVDPASQTVRVGPGCTSGDVDHATHAFGLAVPFGIVSTTGVAGLTLGGGSGYLTRKHGLTIDNLLEADVVLADGSFVTANAKDNPDLFWALRGGGGNFGVVTSFLFQAHPVKMVFAGPIFWDAKYGKEIMAAYRDFLPTAPEELGIFVGLKTVPSMDPFPREAWGQRACAHHRQLQRLRGGRQEGARAAARQASRTVLQLDGHHALPGDAGAVRPVLPERAAVVLEGRLRDGPPDEAIDGLCRRVRRRRRANCASCTSIRSTAPCIGSAGTRRRGQARDATWSMVIAGIDSNPQQAGALTRWGRAYWDAVHRFNPGGAYVNFMMDDEGEARVKASYGDNYARLAAVKKKYDPANLFRVNQNIQPAA